MNIDKYNKSIAKVLKKNNYEELKNKSILIIGGNGLIGAAIIDVLKYMNDFLDYNISIYTTIRSINKIPDRFKNTNINIIEYDVLNKLELKDKIDYVINTASPADPRSFSTNPIGVIETNFIGTKNILEYCSNNNVKRFLYVSSGEVYGQAREDIESFDENYSGKIDPTSFRSCYPLGKLSAENLCVCYKEQKGLDVVIARPCHTYGPTIQRSDSRASSQFILNVVDGNDIVMKSEGKQIRSYCYSLDCVTGLLRILVSGISGEAYNVSNNNSIVSIRELAELISKHGNKKVIFEIPDEQEKKGYNPVTRSVLDGNKLNNIGWIPYYNAEKGLKETIEILKK